MRHFPRWQPPAKPDTRAAEKDTKGRVGAAEGQKQKRPHSAQVNMVWSTMEMVDESCSRSRVVLHSQSFSGRTRTNSAILASETNGLRQSSVLLYGKRKRMENLKKPYVIQLCKLLILKFGTS